MYRTNARVKGGKLYQSQTESHLIVVGTPGWFDWLEQHRAFLFVDRKGSFTAYKSGTNPDGEIWEAVLAHHRHRSHILLGRSRELSLKRLQAAAQTFAVLELTGEVRTAPRTSKQRKYKTPVGSPTSLLHTKLYRPAGGSDVIPQARLMQRLTAALEGRVTLVCAPAGFGKTTPVVEWVQTIGHPTAWLSLDEGGNEFVVFVSSLVAALQIAFPDAFGAISSLLSAPHFPHSPPPYRVATLIANDLAALPEEIVLVLDDFHHIRHADVHALLESLISHLPPQVHVVLVSRSDPPLPIATWLGQRQRCTYNRISSANSSPSGRLMHIPV